MPIDKAKIKEELVEKGEIKNQCISKGKYTGTINKENRVVA